ncbi:Lipid A export ATP-binding/permease protein MsbA [compost metagenome]
MGEKIEQHNETGGGPLGHRAHRRALFWETGPDNDGRGSVSLVRKSELVIMDEPTSGLDSENARLVWEIITKKMKLVTRIISTHELSHVHEADQIIVINKGRVIEIGNHRDLIAKKGLYYSIYNQDNIAKYK